MVRQARLAVAVAVAVLGARRVAAQVQAQPPTVATMAVVVVRQMITTVDQVAFVLSGPVLHALSRPLIQEICDGTVY